ncbi:T-lymphocyte surface antigen Ly-9-like isoform X2 [Mobula hypostoma]|uniref:T-lymphocyte surface antigen Ly-9-like isoform X2 n=1 Tax=Mobula hypostoma TaxID=723540 RepID=UPI002FC396D1
MITGPLLICSCLTLSISVFTSGTGAPPTTVNGTRGHSVSLPTGIPVRPDDAEVVWNRVSPRIMIVKYLKDNITYFGPEEYKRRITFHPGNFSLEIHDLRREDSGDYEVMFAAAGSGAESKTTVRLEVYEPVSGTNITVQNNTGVCNFTLTCSVMSGDSTSFRWWRGDETVVNDSLHNLWGHGETLEIHHTPESMDVVYKCEARNPVSTDTAEIRLWEICKLHTSDSTKESTQIDNRTDADPVSLSPTLVIGLSVVGAFLVSILIVILLVTWRRRAAGKETSSGTEDPAAENTVYANIQWNAKSRTGRQPPKGNKRFVDPEVHPETPQTEYAAVMFRARPHPGSAGEAARR